MRLEPLRTYKNKLLYKPEAAVDERSRMVAVLNNLILHLHPTSVPAGAVRFTYTWGLGGISMVLAMLLGLTGVLLMFRYDARVDYAYTSIQELETTVMFGSLVRAIHHWSANLLVCSVFLHLLRVFFTGGYKQGRTMNWLIGVSLLLFVLAANFTGYLLPWDQLAYWAITVSTSLLSYIPAIGSAISRFLLAGPEVGQGALSNFYALHVVVIPILLAGVMLYHFWKVRKNGGVSQPLDNSPELSRKVTTLPNLVNVEFAVATIVITAVLVMSMFKPAPLGPIANPLDSPNPAKAAWYFLGLQELLLHMHPLAAIILVGGALLAMFAIPSIDHQISDIGIYFRSPAGKRAALLGLILGIDLIPLLVILDEYWVNLPALAPASWPDFIGSGALPLALSLLGLSLVYGLMRLVVVYDHKRANRSEALVGLFTFLCAGLIMLTIIGIFFRGENMALVLPIH